MKLTWIDVAATAVLGGLALGAYHLGSEMLAGGFIGLIGVVLPGLKRGKADA